MALTVNLSSLTHPQHLRLVLECLRRAATSPPSLNSKWPVTRQTSVRKDKPIVAKNSAKWCSLTNLMNNLKRQLSRGLSQETPTKPSQTPCRGKSHWTTSTESIPWTLTKTASWSEDLMTSIVAIWGSLAWLLCSELLVPSHRWDPHRLM